VLGAALLLFTLSAQRGPYLLCVFCVLYLISCLSSFNVTILFCSYPCTDITNLRQNPIHALIHVNTTLFTLLHTYMFQSSRGHLQEVLFLLTKCISTPWGCPLEGWNMYDCNSVNKVVLIYIVHESDFYVK